MSDILDRLQDDTPLVIIAMAITAWFLLYDLVGQYISSNLSSDARLGAFIVIVFIILAYLAGDGDG